MKKKMKKQYSEKKKIYVVQNKHFTKVIIDVI